MPLITTYSQHGIEVPREYGKGRNVSKIQK